MRKVREIELSKPKEASVTDELDALNARFRGKKNSPELIRRSMEAQLEAKAKRRRSRQQAATQQGIAAGKRVS